MSSVRKGAPAADALGVLEGAQVLAEGLPGYLAQEHGLGQSQVGR